MSPIMTIDADDVLLVIDIQNDFLPGGALPVADGDAIVPLVNRLIRAFAHVVVTQDWHTPHHVSFASSHTSKKPFETTQLPYGTQVLWPDHCVQGSDDAALHKDLKLPTAELIIRKGYHKETDSYSAFMEADGKTATGLAGYLKERGVDTLFLTGLATDFCVAWSALDARKFGFATASTSADAVLEDSSLDAIFIVTRHQTHAELVCRALETGKAVFVEKPLALSHDELDRVVKTVAKTGNDRLMVGFNRRFAPLLIQMKDGFGPGTSTSVTRYLVNAGPLDPDSWYSNEEAQGSRFAGEGGHFIDTLTWWAGSLPEEVYAVRGPQKDDVQATVRFANGSCGSIAYLTGGNSRYPKETLDATGAGRTARLDNFRSMEVWAGRRRSTARARGGQDKGQRTEMERFVEAVRTGGPMPVGLDSLVATTSATVAVGVSLLTGRPERV